MGAAPAKRALDLAIAGPALLLLSPLLVLLAVAVKLDSPGPAFFVQERAGLDGRPFRIYKYRTMRVHAHTPEEERLIPAAHDARITRMGRLLRALSLDELPQLLNVLEGSMSLVGPRPMLVTQAAGLAGETRRRLEVPPGLTGWAQVNGRNTLSWERRIALDLWYVEHRSLRLDLAILRRTLGVVARREGIYHDPA